MKRLTAEQAARRRNTRLDHELPLLASLGIIPQEWRATPEGVQTQWDRARGDVEIRIQKMADIATARFNVLCDVLMPIVGYDALKGHLERCARLYPSYSLDYYNEYLFTRLLESDRETGQRLCSHAKPGGLHEWTQIYSQCPRCGKELKGE
jgi:hypothetical protein